MPLKNEPIKEYTDKQANIVEDDILNELKNKGLDKHLKK